MNTGIEVADLNWVWNSRPLTEKDTEIVKQLIHHYQELNLPFWWWVYPCGKSKKTKMILLNEGFQYREAIACMAMLVHSLPALRIKKNDELEISLVNLDSELQIWNNISFAGFDMPQKTKTQFQAFTKSFDVSNKSCQKLFLAYWEGKPAATALLFLQGHTAGIYFVTTLAAYRNRGIALALVINLIKYAQSLGYKYCVLQSSKEGFNVYLRAGFKECCRVDVYCLPD